MTPSPDTWDSLTRVVNATWDGDRLRWPDGEAASRELARDVAAIGWFAPGPAGSDPPTRTEMVDR